MGKARATHIGTYRYFVDVDDPERTVKARRTGKDRYYYLKERAGGEWTRILQEEFDAMWEAGRLKKRTFR